MLGVLPSYTQLGMAALLPGKNLEMDGATSNVNLDGQSTVGTQNRSDIVKAALNGRGVALQAEQFLEMNTKTEGRALMRDHDVVYIYHNAIDTVGDSASTEAQTVDAVERAFGELMRILKKIANINASNMLLTSDHGFLFQQEALAEGDMAVLPQAADWTYRNRRFAIGAKVQNGPGVKLFQAADLGLAGEWAAAFPLSLGRFPLKGSGKRYVHGGVALQEVVGDRYQLCRLLVCPAVDKNPLRDLGLGTKQDRDRRLINHGYFPSTRARMSAARQHVILTMGKVR